MLAWHDSGSTFLKRALTDAIKNSKINHYSIISYVTRSIEKRAVCIVACQRQISSEAINMKLTTDDVNILARVIKKAWPQRRK